MLTSAKNGVLLFSDGTMDYIRFGTGDRILIILPGLGDGLKTVKGTALPMAFLYRMFRKDFTVYAFSRKHPAKEHSSTRDMAAEVKAAMDLLGISRADVLGVSMGGMIAQHLAADHPEAVNRLILTVTCPCPNPILLESLEEWTRLARNGDHTTLMDSNVRRIYSEDYYRKNKLFIPIVGKLTKPASYDRFLTLAEACRTHDASGSLHKITAPTLVIGGALDRCLGADASRILADAIPGATLKLYPQWGHGLYEEAPDFNETVLSFLKEREPHG